MFPIRGSSRGAPARERSQRRDLGVPPQRRAPQAGQVSRDEYPLQHGTTDLPEQPKHGFAAGGVAGERRQDLDDVEELEAERLGDRLTTSAIREAEQLHRGAEVAPLRRPPSRRRRPQTTLVVARSLARPRLAPRRRGGRVEQGRVVGSGHRDHRDAPVRHVAARVQRERHLVHGASDDRERKTRSRLAIPPVVDHEPAGDAGLPRDAAIGHRGDLHPSAVDRVRRHDERAGGRCSEREV